MLYICIKHNIPNLHLLNFQIQIQKFMALNHMIFWHKIVIFHTKCQKIFRASLRSAQFFYMLPSLTWNPGSVPDKCFCIKFNIHHNGVLTGSKSYWSRMSPSEATCPPVEHCFSELSVMSSAKQASAS